MSHASGPFRAPAQPAPPVIVAAGIGGSGGVLAWARLVRPHQWLKQAFVLVGPVYGGVMSRPEVWGPVVAALAAFCLASSACYIVNDLQDQAADRLHPRKRLRPIASGAVAPGAAAIFATVLLLAAFAAVGAIYPLALPRGHDTALRSTMLVAGAVILYVINTLAYSLRLKRLVIADVMSLSMGFVLRVLGGCAAAMVEPSSWLLNVTLFVSMFLAFGKRLGERRTMGEAASAARSVQSGYTDDMLRMMVAVTAVACLVTYAGYVQAQATRYTYGFNLLWLTTIPALYAMLRAIVQMERGRFDDPTELAGRDRPFQAAGVAFVVITGALMASFPPVAAH